MTLKASRLPVLAGVLCLLLVGFAGVSYGAVRFDVVPSPTEVINTGRSEVVGSVNLIVRGTGNVTGTSAGGFTQIGLIYTNPAMQIDNGTTTGIKLIFSTGFAPANPRIFEVANRDINGQLSGFITINLEYGISVAEGEFLRVEGVRGRIYDSLARTPGTDLFVDLQSINDPAANSFTPDRVRVAKSLDGMGVEISDDSLLLCFPTLGRIDGTPDYYIDIYEGFARAFVDDDANNDGDYTFDRVDSEGDQIGDPTVGTHFYVWLEGIPSSVDDISWDDSSYNYFDGSNYSFLELVDYDFDSTTGTAYGVYQYQTTNQTDWSDISYEVFTVKPIIELKSTTQTATGKVYAAVTLYPNSSPNRPRFFKMFESDRVATNNPPDDPPALYASVIRCNCFLLFTYVTVDSSFNTGFAIANTTGDSAPFGANEAPDQLGKITFYFYDKAQGYVGSTTTTDDVLAGKTFTGLVSQLLPSGVTTFSGYVIAKSEFQFCHGLAFIADQGFASVMHGYIANVIPDPAIRNMGGRRAPVAAGDSAMIPAGESLNN